MVSIWLKCNILYDPFYFFFQFVICQKIKKKMPGFDPATNDFFLSFFKIASKKLNPLFLMKSHSSLQSLPASVSLHVKGSKLFPVQWKGWDNKLQGLQITSRSSAGSSSSVSREPGTCGHLWERWRQEQEGPRAWTRCRDTPCIADGFTLPSDSCPRGSVRFILAIGTGSHTCTQGWAVFGLSARAASYFEVSASFAFDLRLSFYCHELGEALYASRVHGGC